MLDSLFFNNKICWKLQYHSYPFFERIIMKRTTYSLALLLIIFSIGVYGQTFERFSKNPIPKLNVLGIALSENTTAAKTVLNDFFRDKMKLKVEFNMLVDPTYKKLGEQKSIDISFFGKSVTGKKFYSAADSILDFNANTFTLLIIDRNKKVRAFSQTNIIDPRNLEKTVEELLLNLDGKEIITVESGDPDATGWQTDLSKEQAGKEKKGFVISLGPKKEDLWYANLGKEIPDIELKTIDGTDVKLHDAVQGKVSVLLFFVASQEPDDQMVSIGTNIMLNLINDLYHAFELGEAKPGDELVKNAVPEPESKPKN